MEENDLLLFPSRAKEAKADACFRENVVDAVDCISCETLSPERPALRFVILGLCAIAIIGAFYSFDSLAAVSAEMNESLGITQSEYGLLYSMYTFPNIFLPVISGMMIDRIGVRTGTFILGLFITIGTIVTALATLASDAKVNYYVMLLGRFLLGCGAESSYVAFDTFALIWFKGKYLAFALGITAGAGQAGEILTFNTMPVFSAELGGWKFALMMAAVVSCFAFCSTLAAIFLDKYGEEKRKVIGIPLVKSTDGAFLGLYQIKSFPLAYWVLILILAINYGTIYPFISYASEYYQNRFDLDEEVAGRYVSVLSVTAMVSGPLLGLVLDKWGQRIWWLNIGNFLQSVSLGVLAFTDADPILPAILIGLSYGLVPAALFPGLAILIDDKYFSTAYGLGTSCANLLMTLTFWVVGYFIDETGDYQSGMFFLCLLTSLGFLLGVLWNFIDYQTGGKVNKTTIASETSSSDEDDENLTLTSERDEDEISLHE